jgi:hypothetical protein
VARAAEVSRARLVPERVASLHFSAVSGIVQERAAGLPRSVEGPFIDFLVDAYPSSVPAPDALAFLAGRGIGADEARALLVRGLFSGAVDPHYAPLPLAARAGARPRAWHVSRDDARARARSRACTRDGPRRRSRRSRAAHRLRRHARPRRARAGRIATLPDALEIVGHYLERFALAGLLEA